MANDVMVSLNEACKWWENELNYPGAGEQEAQFYKTKIAEFKNKMLETLSAGNAE